MIADDAGSPVAALSREELAQKARFEAVHERSQTPIMLQIERCVCGCDYGGDSWTTRAEADEFKASLGLKPGVKLLDLGAGTGWPGLYLAAESGCHVTLVDLPLNGLRIAMDRARRDGLSGQVTTMQADAADLAFAPGSFDAISHSDLLCCLKQKQAVLSSCRRIIAPTGRMAFTVILVPDGLSEGRYRSAVASGPEFIASEASYETMLDAAGWSIIERRDYTSAFRDSCRRQLQADRSHAEGLTALLGAGAFSERIRQWQPKIDALGERLIQRHYFVVAPR